MLKKWLDIQPEETRLLVRAALLYFVIRGAGSILNHFSDTAFLKRVGVEYLPLVYVGNALVSVVMVWLGALLSAKIGRRRIMTYALLFCGLSTGSLRLLVLWDPPFLYSVLFILKAQFELLLGLLFWNLANDIYDTRTSKRLFPLLTLGGVLGGALGSVTTPLLSSWLTPDNLLFVYLAVTSAGALFYRTLFLPIFEKDAGGVPESDSADGVEGYKEMLSRIGGSAFLILLMLLSFLPNVLLPILNYQFRFAVDQYYLTEGGLISFFGYFWAAMQFVILMGLLFTRNLSERWGLPILLLFHPLNYLVVFVLFALRLDILTAVYARFSTTILRTVVNRPAKASIFGLLPDSYRAQARFAIRGSVTKAGIITGSLIILLSDRFFQQSHLSLIAAFFAAAWIGSTLILKRRYYKVLLERITEDLLSREAFGKADLVGLEARHDKAQLLRMKFMLNKKGKEFPSLSAAIPSGPGTGPGLGEAAGSNAAFRRLNHASLDNEEHGEEILPGLWRAMGEKGTSAQERIRSLLSHEKESIRLAALGRLEVADERDLRRVLHMLDDPSDTVHEMAKLKLYQSYRVDPKTLLRPLENASQRTRQGIRSLLELLDIPDPDRVDFSREHLEKSYRELSWVRSLTGIPSCPEREFLNRHLRERARVRLDNVLSLQAGRDSTGRLRTILRGLSSKDPRLRSNSLEALQELMDPEISGIVLPLLEDRPLEDILENGSQYYRLPVSDKSEEDLYAQLLNQEDPLTKSLVLRLIGARSLHAHFENTFRELQSHEDPAVKASARETKGENVRPGLLRTLEKLGGTGAFERLTVEELLRLALISDVRDYETGDSTESTKDSYWILLSGRSRVRLDPREEADGSMLLVPGDGLVSFEKQLFLEMVSSSRFLVTRRKDLERIGLLFPAILLSFCGALARVQLKDKRRTVAR